MMEKNIENKLRKIRPAMSPKKMELMEETTNLVHEIGNLEAKTDDPKLKDLYKRTMDNMIVQSATHTLYSRAITKFLDEYETIAYA